MDGGGDSGESGDQVIVFMADGHTQGGQSVASDHSNTNTTNVDRRGDHLKAKPLQRVQSTNTLRKRATLRRLSFSKPKSRNLEFNFPPKKNVTTGEFERDQTTIWEEEVSNNCNGIGSDTDFSSSSSEDEEEEEEEKSGGGNKQYHKIKKKKRKIKWKRVGEWSLFLVILTCLILSLTVDTLRHYPVMGLVPWQWCLLAMVVFSGRLCSGWLVSFLVFLIERNFMLREKVLYFVYGLRKSIQSCIWLALVLLAWTCMFNAKVHQNNKVVKRVSQLLVAILVGAIIWLVKIVLVKTLASSFHVRTYFDRMKESVFHHYILDTLSGPAMNELLWEEHKPILGSKSLPTNWKDAKNAIRSKKYGSRKLDMDKLKELSMETPASIWSLKRLMNYIRSSSLSTISKNVDEFGKAESEITSEWQARTTAKRIFRNVAKCGAKYVEEEDLSRFLKRNEIHAIFPLFEGALETGRITKSSFRNWVMIVEEMNILTTVFLRYDMEKIYYPNSALLTKPISNFYRSPEMWDTIPFTIDASTPIETINALKKATQSYIDSKPNHWNSKHSFIVKDIEDLNKMKMGLSVQHTINHQNIGERNIRLTDLILDLKKNFESLGIKYHLLPQEVHLTQLNINNSSLPTPS
ncbi:mechanosensitive ion channel protein 10 isoform X2 [Spinacia oleracea]|uniref:Mechanosensitive ion channel protein 10 isoform X2 n=1 Tax=Spinacia oleracea TaxID=3562 RepID=A0A9R0ILH8_SPIOL|nr:mechanosensitive ion channel protein 10-like isoform X2 [Spinacia oleracea]